MALARDTSYDVEKGQNIDPQLVNAATIFGGSLMGGVNPIDGAAAPTLGRSQVWAGAAAGIIPLMFNMRSTVTGDVAATTGEGPPRTFLDIDKRVVKDLTTAGLAGNESDMFRLVYATDDGTFTLTRPAAEPFVPFGFVCRAVSATVADVLFFSATELMILALAGGASDTLYLGTISGISGGGGTFATGVTAPYHGTMLSCYGIVVEPLVTGGADLDINLEIGGVNVTGGVIEWLLANGAGTKKTGTAITAANVVNAGDLIDIEVTQNSASTGGLMAIYAVMAKEIGL